MQTVLTSEFKRGMVLLLDGAPQMLEEFHVSGTAQTRHKLHARLRHLKTGRLTDHTFAEGERVPVADVQHRRVRFSYHDGKDYVFSDVESFDEMSLSAELVGERRRFIKEEVEYRALLLDGRLGGRRVAASRDAGGGGNRSTRSRRLRRHVETRQTRHRPGNHGPAVHRSRRKNPRGHDRPANTPAAKARGRSKGLLYSPASWTVFDRQPFVPILANGHLKSRAKSNVSIELRNNDLAEHSDVQRSYERVVSILFALLRPSLDAQRQRTAGFRFAYDRCVCKHSATIRSKSRPTRADFSCIRGQDGRTIGFPTIA